MVIDIQIPPAVSTNTREEKVGVPCSVFSEIPPVEVVYFVIVRGGWKSIFHLTLAGVGEVRAEGFCVVFDWSRIFA